MTYISDKYDVRAESIEELVAAGLYHHEADREATSRLTLEHVKDQILRLAHTADDDRVRRVIATARAMVESAYGLSLHDATVTAIVIEPARGAVLPRNGFSEFIDAVTRREGDTQDAWVWDKDNPGDFPFYVVGRDRQELHRRGSSPLFGHDIDELVVSYKVKAIDSPAAVEAWALTCAYVYETKLPYAIGRSVATLPDAARDVLQHAGFVNVAIA